MTDLSEKIVEAAAREDAAFDGRPWESMSRADRERYLARARRTQRVVLPILGEEITRIAEEWPAIKRLLPLCDDAMNGAAETGQVEAGERIADAQRTRLSEIMDGLK